MFEITTNDDDDLDVSVDIFDRCGGDIEIHLYDPLLIFICRSITKKGKEMADKLCYN
jgi:hypothetical protein